MSSLTERFNAPLPSWIYNIKKEAHQKIMKSRLIIDCREFNEKAMKTLMIRFWPFVDEFPEVIWNHQILIFIREFLRRPIYTLFLIDTVSKTLGKIKSDEKNHKSLWLDTSLALGLDERDLYLGENSSSVEGREVRETIEKVGESVSIFGNKTSSSTAILRLAAVEIVAESISHELIVIFNDLDTELKREAEEENKELKIKPSQWFREHIYHKDGVMSHEELVYRLAFALDGREPEKERTNKIIQEVVDLFVEAGETPY